MLSLKDPKNSGGKAQKDTAQIFVGCQSAKSPKQNKKKDRSADPRVFFLFFVFFLRETETRGGVAMRALLGLVVRARRRRSCVAGLVAMHARANCEQGVVSRWRLGAAGCERDAGRGGSEGKLLEGRRQAVLNASCGGFLV